MQVYPTSNIFLGPDPNDTLTVDVSNKKYRPYAAPDPQF